MRKFFALAIAGLMAFASCSSSDDGPSKPANGEDDASLQINFTNTSYVNTRAGDDRTLNTATIFALNADGRILKSFYEADMTARPSSKEYKVVKSVSKLIIIGNAGDLTSTKGYISDIKELVRKVDGMSTAATTGVWMYGESTTAFTFPGTSVTDPDLPLQTCTITMHLIPAKVRVIAKNELDAASTLTIDDVSFLYGAQYTHLAPQRTATAGYNDIYAPEFTTVAGMTGTPTYYVSGFQWGTPAVGGTVYTPYKQAWTGAADLDKTFYVLPGYVATSNSSYQKAIVTISTTRHITEPTPKTEKEYFSIFFNTSSKHVGEYLSSGKAYTITLTLRDDPNGPPDPTIEFDAMISMEIAIDDWDPKVVSKVFE